MITVTDLRKVYRQGEREVIALDGVTLSVPTGSIHGIIGHSGAGKSTLVRCLTLLDRPTSGTVAIGDKELSSVSDAELLNARRSIGMVFQHANLFDSRTTFQNVAFPLELTGTPKAAIAVKVNDLLNLVGLGAFADAYPAQLSGGQKQRVGIARALATDPDVLLCDEPTSALDPKTTDEILDLVKDLRDRLGITVLVITHEMDVVKRICNSVSLLEAGRIVEHGALAEVVARPGGRLSAALLPLPGIMPEELPAGLVLDLLYSGDQAAAPVISDITRRFDVDVNVLAGSVESLGGAQFAHLRILLPVGSDVPAIKAHLSANGIAVTSKEA
ncbi:methionine ABC transporter ATP-binding protein [Paeniglutamicibacter cryotolerans]|uniref:D-methionine transport system ATP-binding protein n=1 Tax=Paeniglutamicibacter cryotolerans TaxID=670079 RepID=A0A839QPI9_9MICC|nr:ATP-binding cassette domain-containing protein [Paeniglutamicibacter cryotolerans]MBB2996555.1 D-methionine transport system ATP-binding protein [Paeniglutamicibacter cryotolerans]